MKENSPRRRILKAALGAGGAAAIGLPERWLKPVVQATMLPAHAQTSGGDEVAEEPPASPQPCSEDLLAVLSWSDPVDLDLRMRLPGGLLMEPGTSNGPHSISADVSDAPGGETATILCDEASNPEGDRYQLFVRNNSQTTAAFSLSITTPVESATIECASLAPDSGVRVAYVDYSGGQGGVVELAPNPASCTIF